MASNTPKVVLGVVIAVIAGMLLAQPAITAVENNTGDVTVTNETVTANVGQYVALGGFDVNPNSETVWAQNSSGTYVQATNGTDYEFDDSRGAIKALNSSSLIQDGETLKVTYTYRASGQTTALVAGFIPVLFFTLLLVVPAMKVMDFV